MPQKKKIDSQKLDQIVADAIKNREKREQDYRARALKLYPWICGRCEREFSRTNLSELTVHHRDHDHDNNPEDGTNWELLCVYCHENEHSRFADQVRGEGYELTSRQSKEPATGNPFANLREMMESQKKS